ncbi:hypothetical protein QN277_027197 [Acacia crassicarpa]|uniref:Uncharacterized protein n=1 Tax=Acacia crassicarpa TaxID=499986 RepID=A0AAE1J9A0_9FABA|nr:hypothetical protein QN277_027197 [Acacia crassicarpa]
MAVRRDVPGLSNGTGRRKSKNMQLRVIPRSTTVASITMAPRKMVMSISGGSNLPRREDIIMRCPNRFRKKPSSSYHLHLLDRGGFKYFRNENYRRKKT